MLDYVVHIGLLLFWSAGIIMNLGVKHSDSPKGYYGEYYGLLDDGAENTKDACNNEAFYGVQTT